ncbi:MAG: acyltransferase [SAR202 cluster bacterium]|nr:acyltransferase [SAR202 cluster bacterium]
MIKKIINELKQFLNFLVTYFPGSSGNMLRRSLYKVRLNSLGTKLYTEIGLRLTCPRNIVIGNNASFMRGCSLNSCEGKINIGDNISTNQNVDINSSNGGFIEIGNDVLIGNNVLIRAADHVYNNKSKKINQSGHVGGKIIIGNNVWIGANCVILKNVTIKDGSVIGAGTVVTTDVDSNELAISNKQVNKKLF